MKQVNNRSLSPFISEYFTTKIEEEEFEDTKGEVRICKWKKDRQSEEIR